MDLTVVNGFGVGEAHGLTESIPCEGPAHLVCVRSFCGTVEHFVPGTGGQLVLTCHAPHSAPLCKLSRLFARLNSFFRAGTKVTS